MSDPCDRTAIDHWKTLYEREKARADRAEVELRVSGAAYESLREALAAAPAACPTPYRCRAGHHDLCPAAAPAAETYRGLCGTCNGAGFDAGGAPCRTCGGNGLLKPLRPAPAAETGPGMAECERCPGLPPLHDGPCGSAP